MKNADIFRLDGKVVMALLLGAVRAEQFCDGTLLNIFQRRQHPSVASAA